MWKAARSGYFRYTRAEHLRIERTASAKPKMRMMGLGSMIKLGRER